MAKTKLVLFFILFVNSVLLAQVNNNIYSFIIGNDVTITIDQPIKKINSKKKAMLILFALPNGNTTAQTMGKKMEEGDDWHFDIQHIKAQTHFLRNQLTHKNIIVAYLENKQKSWPAWKQQHSNFALEINHIVDTISSLFNKPNIYLNGHIGFYNRNRD